jgi:hypothetical protein
MAPQLLHSFHIAGEQVAFGIVAALIYRCRSGAGKRLTCAVHEAVSKSTETDLMAWVVQRQPFYRQTARHAGPVVGGEIPDVYFEPMTGLGHFPMAEDPDHFTCYLLPVLDRIARS